MPRSSRTTDVDRISFTGSPETAELIAEAAAPNLTPLSFELGGKSPFVVFADADLDAAAREVAGQYVNAGQVCLAGTRLLVEESIADDFLERVRTALDRLPVGDPRDLATRIGPLITPEHFDRVKGFVDRAVAAGARAFVGRRAPRARWSLVRADPAHRRRPGDARSSGVRCSAPS